MLLLHENIFAYTKVTFIQIGQIFTIGPLGVKSNNYNFFSQLHPFGGYSSTPFKILKISLMYTH